MNTYLLELTTNDAQKYIVKHNCSKIDSSYFSNVDIFENLSNAVKCFNTINTAMLIVKGDDDICNSNIKQELITNANNCFHTYFDGALESHPTLWLLAVYYGNEEVVKLYISLNIIDVNKRFMFGMDRYTTAWNLSLHHPNIRKMLYEYQRPQYELLHPDMNVLHFHANENPSC